MVGMIVQSERQSHWRFRAGAFALVAILAIRLLFSIQHTALVTDEFAHIPAGYVNLKIHRFDLNPEHPPLIKMLAAVPLMFLQPPLPGNVATKKDWSDWFRFCTDFFALPIAQERQVITWARVPMILISCLLGLLIFKWASALYSPAAGLFSLLLYTMEPNVLALSRFVYTDIGASLVYFAFFYLAWRCWRTPTFASIVLCCLMAGLALLVKHSMVVVFPLCLVLLASLVISGKITLRAGCAHAVLGLLMLLLLLNLCYGFRTHGFNTHDLQVVSGWFGIRTDRLGIGPYLDRYSFLPIPADYIRGLDMVMNHNREGHYTYLMGKFSDRGWWYYFPVVFLVKVPLPIIFLVSASLIGLGAALFRKRNADLFFLLLPILFYSSFALISNINIGIRHILPIFPFLFLLCGGLWHSLYSKASRWHWAPVALGFWAVFCSLSFHYDPLEYINEFAGGPDQGWRYLGESNIDAGQNMIRLANYIKETRPGNMYMYLIGVDINLLRNLNYAIFTPMKITDDFRANFPYTYREEYGTLKPGVYAISVCRMLDPQMYSPAFSKEELARAQTLQRFLEIEPDKKIGSVIWIYHLTAEKIARLNLSQLEFHYFLDFKYERR